MHAFEHLLLLRNSQLQLLLRIRRGVGRMHRAGSRQRAAARFQGRGARMTLLLLMLLLLQLLVIALEEVLLKHAGVGIVADKVLLFFGNRLCNRGGCSSASVLTPRAQDTGASRRGSYRRRNSGECVAGMVGAALMRAATRGRARARFNIAS